MVHRHIRTRSKLMWRRGKRFAIHSVLRADDPPQRLARGVAVGLFVAFTPFLGLHMIMVIVLAWLLRANQVVGIAMAWVCNPATFPLIYPPCYFLGAVLMDRPILNRQWWDELFAPPPGWWEAFKFEWSKIMEIIVPLTLGTTVVGLVVAAIAYPLTLYVVRSYRRRHHHPVLPRPHL